MRTIYTHEIKNSIKTLFIWFICVGSMGFACILLFASMKESMENIAESFASMGAFSDAFGMSQLSMATLPGFYATEVGAIQGLGGAMFAAIISTSMLSKEEDGHTSEFLLSLPMVRHCHADLPLPNPLRRAISSGNFNTGGKDAHGQIFSVPRLPVFNESGTWSHLLRTIRIHEKE